MVILIVIWLNFYVATLPIFLGLKLTLAITTQRLRIWYADHLSFVEYN